MTDPNQDPDKLNNGLSDEMAEYLQTFVDETDEQLDDLVEIMLTLEDDSTNPEALNEAFRLIHSIKGSAGIMGFESITALTHHLENRFEQFRSGRESMDDGTMSLVLRSIDFLRDCNGRLRSGETLGSPATLLSELRNLEQKKQEDPEPKASESTPEHADADAETDEPEVSSEAPQVSLPTGGEPAPDGDATRVLIGFQSNLQLIDLKAKLVLKRLAEVGEVISSNPDIENSEAFEGLEQFEVFLSTDSSADDLKDRLNVAGVESVNVQGMTAATTDIPGPPKSENDEDPPATETESSSEDSKLAIESDDLAGREILEESEVQESSPSESIENELRTDVSPPTNLSAAVSADLPEEEPIVTDAKKIEEATDVRLPVRQKKKPVERKTTGPGNAVSETMRVGIDRLDNLMNLTGELVINRARFEQISEALDPSIKKSTMRHRISEFRENLEKAISEFGDGNRNGQTQNGRIEQLREGLDLLDEQSSVWENGRAYFGQIGEAIDQLSRVSDSLQRSVLDTRMVSVGPMFNRFKRVVRDLSKERGKSVMLVLRGESTEMDKRLIDEMGDPLIHLVRNSIDHGLETIEERLQNGKPREGTIHLTASQNGNNVYIEIIDDGQGIDDQKIRRKIVEKGILSEADANELTREQAINFIWEPGFSTATELTDISGRGVGMDVVKTRIGQLNGTIEVDSKPGEGTRFTIRLPLTLAIINCLVVKLCGETFSIPLDDVREIVSVKTKEIISALGTHSFELRGNYLPLIQGDDVFTWAHEFEQDSCSYSVESAGPSSQVVVLQAAGKTIGLQVDKFLGSQDIVVKSLSDNFASIPGLSGASIMGDGTVALMLDVGALVRQTITATSNTTTLEND